MTILNHSRKRRFLKVWDCKNFPFIIQYYNHSFKVNLIVHDMLGHIPRNNIFNAFFEKDDIRKMRLVELIKGILFITGENRPRNFNVGLGEGLDAILYTRQGYTLIIPEVSFEAFERGDKNPYNIKYYFSDDKEYISYELRLLSNAGGSYPQPYNIIYEEIKRNFSKQNQT